MPTIGRDWSPSLFALQSFPEKLYAYLLHRGIYCLNHENPSGNTGRLAVRIRSSMHCFVRRCVCGGCVYGCLVPCWHCLLIADEMANSLRDYHSGPLSG